MNRYEAMVIVMPDIDKDALSKVLTQTQEVILKNKGSMEEMKELGKQRLAYPIRKYKEGNYYLVSFHIENSEVTKLKRWFGLNDAILRVLIVRV